MFATPSDTTTNLLSLTSHSWTSSNRASARKLSLEDVLGTVNNCVERQNYFNFQSLMKWAVTPELSVIRSLSMDNALYKCNQTIQYNTIQYNTPIEEQWLQSSVHKSVVRQILIDSCNSHLTCASFRCTPQ